MQTLQGCGGCSSCCCRQRACGLSRPEQLPGTVQLQRMLTQGGLPLAMALQVQALCQRALQVRRVQSMHVYQAACPQLQVLALAQQPGNLLAGLQACDLACATTAGGFRGCHRRAQPTCSRCAVRRGTCWQQAGRQRCGCSQQPAGGGAAPAALTWAQQEAQQPSVTELVPAAHCSPVLWPAWAGSHLRTLLIGRTFCSCVRVEHGSSASEG